MSQPTGGATYVVEVCFSPLIPKFRGGRGQDGEVGCNADISYDHDLNFDLRAYS